MLIDQVIEEATAPLLKLMFVGDSLVGKTSFMNFFLVRKSTTPTSTVGIDYREIKKVRKYD